MPRLAYLKLACGNTDEKHKRVYASFFDSTARSRTLAMLDCELSLSSPELNCAVARDGIFLPLPQSFLVHFSNLHNFSGAPRGEATPAGHHG